MKNKNGFTLIEITVCLIITGILACVAVPNYTNYITQGEISSAQNSLLVIHNLQQSYYFTHGQYCFDNNKCADNTTDINTNLKLNITDNHYNYACTVCNSQYAYCCTATNISNGSMVSTYPDGQSSCGGVYKAPSTPVYTPTPIPTPASPVTPSAINCVSGWSACSASCGGGTQSFQITTPASGGGIACVIPSHTVQSCNIQACPINCVGSFSSCTNSKETYSITTPTSNGGTSCPYTNKQIVACVVNCVGSWSSCSNGSQTYIVTTKAGKGGTACPYVNGTTESCGTPCVGSWSSCSTVCGTGTETYTITKSATGGGLLCTFANGLTQDCSNACATGQMCNSNFQCVASTSKTCVPSCAGKACMTSDGCGGEC